jgi:alkylhydroperoxidase/carboxymuconolactone decarboxylase family protein YurZ
MGPDDVTLEALRAEAEAALADVPDGPPLDAATAALLALTVRASVTCLDDGQIRLHLRHALDAGVSAEQAHEALVLVSGLGVHTLMRGSRFLADELQRRGDASITAPLPPALAELRARRIGQDPYWNRFERECPGFLDALLRLSPPAFEAFFDYCALPWKTRALRAVTKELVSIAVDAAPAHRFRPGFRLHLGNAIALGAGRRAVLQTLEIAADAPPHRGTG